VSSEGGVSRVTVGQLQIFAISTDGADASASDTRLLARYFRYFRGGHPAALRLIEEGRRVPASVVMTHGIEQSMRSTIRFTPVRDAPPSASLEGLRKVAPTGLRLIPQDLADTAFRIGSEDPADIARKAEQTHAQAEAFFRQGDALSGLLTSLEYGLQGGAANELLVRNRSAIQSSAQSAAILPYINNATDKAGAERNAAALQIARADAGEKGYVLGIFEANHQIKAGKAGLAVPLFIAALRANPYLAGAWKDLGDVLLTQYMVPDTWMCWDTGRRIAPGFASFQAVNQFEAQLARGHAEYF
jgi:hypothetical protein